MSCVRVDILKDGTATVSDILGDEQFAVDSQTDMATVRVSGPIDSQTDMAIVRSRTLKVPFSRFNHALNEEVFENGTLRVLDLTIAISVCESIGPETRTVAISVCESTANCSSPKISETVAVPSFKISTLTQVILFSIPAMLMIIQQNLKISTIGRRG